MSTVEQPHMLDDPPPVQPVAALAALAFPGAGHAYLGETRRACCIAGGVLGLFFGGIFIGGIDVIDRREDFVWFLGQGLVGPIAFGADYYHQHFLKVKNPNGSLRSAEPFEKRDARTGQPMMFRHPDTGQYVEYSDPRGVISMGNAHDRPPNSKSVGRVNELGTLMSAVAGMLNLICVVDASHRHRVPRRRRVEA